MGLGKHPMGVRGLLVIVPVVLCCAVLCCAVLCCAGRNTDGAAWRETWSERLMYASNDLDTVVERNAHKWAADPSVSRAGRKGMGGGGGDGRYPPSRCALVDLGVLG